MAKAATIPDGYYINWYGDSAIVYDNKCNKMRDWIKENRKALKILDPLWNDIQKLPLVTLQNIHLFL